MSGKTDAMIIYLFYSIDSDQLEIVINKAKQFLTLINPKAMFRLIDTLRIKLKHKVDN